MSTMTPQIYESKRNELITILETIQHDCVNLDAATKKELEATESKLKRNSFEIVLVGEFQGGKSTTFDTICEGREISPRGQGVKTSACKISACSLPDNEDEYVDIAWKTDEELLKTMLGIISEQLVDNPEKLAQIKRKSDDGSLLASLNEPDVYKIALECINKEWEVYKQNKATYDPGSETGKLDLLQISTLILKYYSASELTNWRQKTRIKVEELQKLVVFPKDWLIRWGAKDQDADFSLNEIMFVFLSSAFCHIHCKNLERLGCIITDCPGLFAGPWDTEVAHKAMYDADAILYLIGGTTAIRDSDIKALAYIQSTGQEHKLYYAINARQLEEHVENVFRPNDRYAIVNRTGLKINNDEDIYVFHSRLAFNSIYSIYNGVLNPSQKREMMVDMLGYLDSEWNPETRPQETYNLSGFPQLLKDIETVIVGRKFSAVLIDGGTKKASQALDKLIGSLESEEASARENAEKSHKDAEEARKNLDKFQNSVNQLVDTRLGTNSQKEALKQDFINNVFMNQNNINRMADIITDKMVSLFHSNGLLLEVVYNIIKSKAQQMLAKFQGKSSQENSITNTKLNTLVNDYVKDAIESTATPAMEGWLTNIKQCNNSTFRVQFIDAMEILQEKIQLLWDETYKGGGKLLNGLSITIDTEHLFDNIKNNQNNFGGSIDIAGEAGKVLIQNILKNIAGVLVGIITFVIVDTLIGAILAEMGLLALAASNPVIAIPIILGILGAALFSKEKFRQWLNSKQDAILKGRFRSKITQKLTDSFNGSEVRSGLEKAADTIVSKIVMAVINVFRNSLRDQKAIFETRVQKTAELSKKDEDEKRRIADECSRIRQEQVVPAHKQIVDFDNDLSQYFTK